MVLKVEFDSYDLRKIRINLEKKLKFNSYFRDYLRGFYLTMTLNYNFKPYGLKPNYKN